TKIYFRGELFPLESTATGTVQLATEQIKIPTTTTDLRPAIQKYLRQIAQQELPPRVMEFASQHHIAVTRVSIRNQKSRWGSCSRRGTISLNWRLIQTPEFVRDYVILHELAHRRHMNHSEKFWSEVARLCPNYPIAKQWLKQHARSLT
ncbi:MAG TPA: M48 family metallopeptidase, partial [Verrucomicrobiae bacterium]